MSKLTKLGEANARIKELEADLKHYSERSQKLDNECAGFEAEIKTLHDALEKSTIEAFALGYSCGHNDTVESDYCEPDERAKEWFDEEGEEHLQYFKERRGKE